MRTRVLAAAVAIALGGCSDNAEELPTPSSLQQAIALQGFESCESLEQYIEDTAVLDMRAQLIAARDETWSRGGVPVSASEDTAGNSAPQAPAGPSSYTQTNTQVAGVDEADFVKNDGTRILALAGNQLYITRSWPADQLAIISKVQIEGWPREMFLDESNRVVVFSAVYNRYDWTQAPAGGMPCDWRSCDYYYANTVKMTVLDVSNPAAPRVVREEYVPGSYMSSRRVGGSVRLVLNDSFRWPAGVKFWLDNWVENRAARRAAYNQLIAQNEQLIRAATLAQWLPPARRKLADGTLVDVAYNCSDFSRPNGPTQLGLVTVATLNLNDATAPVHRTSVVADAREIYATPTSLYVANWHWWWWPQPGQVDYTYLHKFDISQPDRATYVASGYVDGHILDQFSMDESNGYLRVASTVSQVIDDDWRRESWNYVSVLAERGGRLTQVGRTPQLAKGERLYSSRFLGNRGFIVTFRQTDPLFSLDLTDPTNPRVVGELKVPGFSTYLHPLDANHLLAIGTYLPDPGASGQTDWRQRALKVTVFDVSNLANPVEKYGATVGSAYSWSEAQYEHKAFNYFAEKGLLAIPFYDWQYSTNASAYWSSFVSDLRVFKIDLATGITPQGALSMSDLYQSETYGGWTWYWTPAVRRSVMADDYVYAISDAGIRSARLGALGTPLKTVAFDRH